MWRFDGLTVPSSGPSLLDLLDNMPMVDRKMMSPLMMPVSEKYKDLGTIVVGKIESGHVKKGDTLTLMPNRDSVEVTALYNEIDEEVNMAVSGDNVKIRLRGVDDEDISPGFVLTSPTKPVRAVRQFEAQLAILEHKNIICAGYSAVMHVHTLAEEVTLVVNSIRPLVMYTVTDEHHRRYCTISIKPLAASRGSRHSSQRRVSLFFSLSRSYS